MLNRREFLKSAMCATATGLLIPQSALAEQDRKPMPWLRMKAMPLLASRNGQTFHVDFRQRGSWEYFRYLTRDVQADLVGNPNPSLGGLLSWMQMAIAQYTGKIYPFEITSGMRTRKTNQSVEGAARNSMHLPDENLMFHAVDFRARGLPSQAIATLAWRAQEGGVGLYTDREFVHVDSGRVRTWIGK